MVYSCPFSKDSERNVLSPQDSLAMRSRTTKATAFLFTHFVGSLKKQFQGLNVHLTAMELTQISDLKLLLDSASRRRQAGKKQSLGLPKRPG